MYSCIWCVDATLLINWLISSSAQLVSFIIISHSSLTNSRISINHITHLLFSNDYNPSCHHLLSDRLACITCTFLSTSCPHSLRISWHQHVGYLSECSRTRMCVCPTKPAAGRLCYQGATLPTVAIMFAPRWRRRRQQTMQSPDSVPRSTRLLAPLRQFPANTSSTPGWKLATTNCCW